MKKALLIDGNAILYKAFYASAFLLEKGEGLDSDGNAINALRTFAMMMIKIREQWKHSHILVAFDDKKTKTYRTEYSFYKINRKKTPDELNRQRPLINKFLDLYGIKWISDARFEADDIIGILSKRYSKDNIDVEIITSDKDLLQLVNPKVKVFLSKTGISNMIEHNYKNFQELNFGLRPKQIVDLKGLMGDSSDSLPGIKGIGEKGAIKLLSQFSSLEEVIKNKNILSKSLIRKIDEGMQMGILCKEIAQIMDDGDFEIPFESITIKEIDVFNLVRFLNLNSIYNVADRIKKNDHSNNRFTTFREN